MAGFTRYSSYKDSGVKWLGEIPTHWCVRRNLGLFDERKETNRPDLELLSVTIDRGVILQTDITIKKDSSNEDKSKYKIVYSKDLAYNKMRMWQGAVGMSIIDGIVSPAYIVLNPRDKGYAQYFHYLYRTSAFAGEANRHSYGIVDDQNSLRYEQFKTIYSPFPPKKEMLRIVAFLDEKTAESDDAIVKKQRVIELLQEQKAILINNAVTKGLNPDVTMKECGVEWIGEIPAHWEVKRAKFIFDEIDERSETGGEELLSVSHMTGVTPRSEKNIFMFMAEDYTGSKLCRENDLVFNIMWAWMGALGVSDRTGIISPSYGVYRQKIAGNFNPWYLEQLLRSTGYVAEYNRRSTGLRSSRLRLYPHMFFDMEIGMLPREEQDRIQMIVSDQTEHIDQAINAVYQEIDKLNELRAVLISNAVTGRIKI